MTARIKALTLITAGTLAAFAHVPAVEFPDTTLLDEVVVSVAAPSQAVHADDHGGLILSTSATKYITSTLGGGDPLSLIKTLPAVQTPNDLQAGMSVRGMDYGDNRYTLNSTRIFNPMHMLGLFSAFNPAFVDKIRFDTGYSPASRPGAPGGVLAAESLSSLPTPLTLSASIGLIESHAGGNIPLIPEKFSLSFGARQSYLNQVFPNILKMGHTRLKYDFSDFAAAITATPASTHLLKASGFYTRDKMTLLTKNLGAKDGDFGWSNAGGGLQWLHDRWNVLASASHFSNRFKMEEGGRTLNLPSRITQAEISGSLKIKEFIFAASSTYTNATGQQNGASSSNSDTSRSRSSILEEVSATWTHDTGRFLSLDAGVRLAAYHTKGYSTFCPMPRLRLVGHLSGNTSIWIASGRFMTFDRLVRETTGGLPADFFTPASALIPPQDVWSINLGAGGALPAALRWTAEIYGRRVKNAGEFKGSLLDLINPSYNPEENLLHGRGYSAGISCMLQRDFGKLRGQIAYNLGVSRLKFAEYGHKYLPPGSDRTHDLSATVSYSPIPSLVFAATFTYATGLPYTKAKYGYMIEENLICEYYEHNSSRLPSYNRLDLSATWTFQRSRTLSHSLNLSVYNATASRNVLFTYPSYSLSEGIRQNESVMKSVIPSLTYTISLCKN